MGKSIDPRPVALAMAIDSVDEMPSVTVFRAADLDEFVARSDALGGPESIGAQAYWQGFRFEPSFAIETTSDPFSEAYVAQQVHLWEEISGRSLNQELNELHDFPFEKHRDAANPYASRDVSTFAYHLASLTNVAIAVDLPSAPRILDLGCGWGLTSEVFAFLGAEVTAIDIGPRFVDLVNTRAQRSGLPIRAYRSTFEAFEPFAVFDMVLFYECLHHAVWPWVVLDRFRHYLAIGGKVALAREPVQDMWWPYWGMRLDPLSIYCMRKFGWFESGFSIAFLHAMAERVGMVLEEKPDRYSSHPVYILRLPQEHSRCLLPIPLQRLLINDIHEGWAQETETRLVAEGRVTINLEALDDGDYVELSLENHRGKPLRLSLKRNGADPVDVILRPGANTLRAKKAGILVIHAETWRPVDELDLPDTRALSFHLVGIASYRSERS